MTNTLNNVIKTLESKGYTVEQVDGMALEIENPESIIEYITPSFIGDGVALDLPIDNFINESTENMTFELYGWTLNFPTAKELIIEIEKIFK